MLIFFGASLTRINWNSVQSQLKEWALKECNQPGVFNETTTKKFMERILPKNGARATTNNDKAQFQPSYGIFHFYDPEFEQINEFHNMKKYIKNEPHLRLLANMNNHGKLATRYFPIQFTRLINIPNNMSKSSMILDSQFSGEHIRYGIQGKG